MQTNKSLGQHWLRDQTTLEAIANFADVQKNDVVLEIGPGQGALTEVLATRARSIIAVEFDKKLAQNLQQKFAKNLLQNKTPNSKGNPWKQQNYGIVSNFKVVQGDFLRFDLTSLPVGYKVVGNVPYYITSAIVRRLLESPNPPKSATLLVQKEVAKRIAAGPGAMSLLGISAQFYTDVRLGPIVKAKLFEPPPKVDSQVVQLNYTGPKFADVENKHFFRLVKAGFAERRKKLRSSLAGGLQVSKIEADRLLANAYINPEARAQELSLEDWHKLALLHKT